MKNKKLNRIIRTTLIAIVFMILTLCFFYIKFQYDNWRADKIIEQRKKERLEWIKIIEKP